MQKLVSIIIPVFRTEKFISRCIDSVKKQTYEQIEIILVDDGSDDSSPQICDRYTLDDSRIKVIHKENGGLSSARNAGIDIAQGEYISFVDSDDYIAEDMIEILMNAIEKYDAELAMIKYQEVKSSQPRKQISLYEETIYLKDEIEAAFHVLKIDSVCVGLYKKECIGNTRFPVGKTSEDIVFNFEIFKKLNVFIYIPIEKYYYYYNPESISNGCLEQKKLDYLNVRLQINRSYSCSEQKKLYYLSGVLVARAAMGLTTRMAVYGIDKNLDEKEIKELLRKRFNEFRKPYFKSKYVPFSRKGLAFMVMNFYPIAKIFGRILRKCEF